MRVLVTGASGFVGSHTAAELVRAGHRIRVLVRTPARAEAALRALGVADFETVVGEVTDPEVVASGMDGCQAVVHCAAIYSLDPRMAEAMRRTNLDGTEIVVGAAHRLALDPIVHVSSGGALISSRGAIVGPNSPPTFPPGAYLRSKADSDRVARGYQSAGAPVVIVYPAVIWGPDDPACGESCRQVADMLAGRWIVSPREAGFPLCDVREVSRLNVAVLEPGRGPRRYMAVSRDISVRHLLETASRLTGRRLPTISLPAWAFEAPLRLADLLQQWLPFRLPANFQSAYVAGLHYRLDDEVTRRELGIQPREIDETVADTIRWMVKSGRLSPRLAGRLGQLSSTERSVG